MKIYFAKKRAVNLNSKKVIDALQLMLWVFLQVRDRPRSRPGGPWQWSWDEYQVFCCNMPSRILFLALGILKFSFESFLKFSEFSFSCFRFPENPFWGRVASLILLCSWIISSRWLLRTLTSSSRCSFDFCPSLKMSVRPNYHILYNQIRSPRRYLEEPRLNRRFWKVWNFVKCHTLV